MIENQRQYQVTKGQIAKLESSVEIARDKRDSMDPRVFEAMVRGLESQIEEMRAELLEYEALAGQRSLRIEHAEDLPEVLIRARIAQGCTQKELAERLGVQPQQVQKYEKTRYQSASLRRVLDAMKALNVEIATDVEIGQTSS